MLPVPNLDDRLFEQLVKDARQAIPKYIPEWTDENYHDPGITLIELLAWFTELQSYYLNRVTTKNELKFLKLVGIYPRDTISAQAKITFQTSQAVIIPKGTQLSARDLVFETEERLICTPALLEKVLVRTEAETNDHSTFNSNNGVAYYAFGQEAQRGSRLYLGFDQALPTRQSLSLMINLYDAYPIKQGTWPAGEQFQFTPSAKLSWQFYGGSEGTATWQALDVLRDETLHFSQSGLLTFSVPQVMQPTLIYPAHERARYWLSCTLEEAGYEVAPRVEEITINTIAVRQRETLSEIHAFSSTGRAEQACLVDTFLVNSGLIEVQVQGSDGYWRDWQEVDYIATCTSIAPVYQLRRDQQSKRITILFGNGEQGHIPPAGSNNIRVICYAEDFAKERILGRSLGLPNQRFELFNSHVLGDGLLVQVGVKRASLHQAGAQEIVWQDWQRVRDFDNSRSFDQHYVLNLDTGQPNGELIFGNNEYGLIPEHIEQDNIRIISCQLGRGEQGNVHKELISQLVSPSADVPQVKLSNHYPASGGQERETLEEAKLRAQHMINKPERAITAFDLEELTRTTPGLRVARVKALPLYEVGLQDYPRQQAAAQVTVVVVPYSEAQKPMPSPGFLDTVKRRLDSHRLITTEVHVVPPEYIKVTVHGVVVVEDYVQEDDQEIITALKRLIHPLDQGDSQGWPFGRTVYIGDVFGVINQVKGVVFIQDLWLEAEGRGIKKEPNGNIILPPHGLVFSGEHQIELVSKRDV